MEMKQKKNLRKTKLNILKIKLKIMFNLKFNNMNNLKFRKNNLKLKNRPNLKLSKNSQNLNDVNNYLSTTFFILFQKKSKNHIKFVKIKVHEFINQLFCLSYLLSIVRLSCNPFRCQNGVSFVDSHSQQHHNVLIL